MKSKINKLLKKKKQVSIPLKHKIHIQKQASLLKIQMHFSDSNFEVKQLWIINRQEAEDKLCVAEAEMPSNTPLFSIDLKEVLKKMSTEQKVYDFYLTVRMETKHVSKKFIKKKKSQATFYCENEKEYLEYSIRVGRFFETVIDCLDPVEVDDKSALVMQTITGNLSLYTNRLLTPKIRAQIEKIVANEGYLRLEGILFSNNSFIKKEEAYIQSRETSEKFPTKIHFIRDEQYSKENFNMQRYTYELLIDLKTLSNAFLKDSIFDLYFKLDLHDYDETFLKKVGRPTNRAKLAVKDLLIKTENVATIISPYFTFKQSNLSFETYNYEREAYDVLNYSMKNAKKLYRKNSEKDIWLVGERVYKAQDTGFRFFEYMRKNYPYKEVYYVIDRDSIEKENVEPLGNVLYYKSKEHIEKTMMATKIISSHHPDYLYPLRTKKYIQKIQGVKVFLQHGVMGTKNMVANYSKKSTAGFDTDLFIVSSDFEKAMIVSDFGYDPGEIAVTGLSRFDTLFKQDVEVKRQILIIPTWRDWITSDEAFLESQYFQRYDALVNSKKLHEQSEQHQFEIVLCLHPNMQKYTKYFTNDTVRVINQGEVDVQRLIKESALMITDYSSVGFDFSFLHKPIIYYQFDRNRFIGKHPSHLNLERDLPGVIVNEYEDLLERVAHYAQSNFKMESEYVTRANKFIKYRDTNACERIYEAVSQAEKLENKWDDFSKSTMGNIAVNQLKKRKLYYPIMKQLYKVMLKTGKVDENLILFESGLGKQYADSPRMIYEEILRQNLPYKKVWVYDGLLPVKDDQTKKIKRLSPEYYYYLAKAKYWINNQNFPTYLDKHKDTTYVQTWHGTPLKKMQFDIENIKGRDEDYLKRVHHATQTWDYLISPSRYATNAFRSAFRYEGEVLETGYPRNDLFYNELEQENIKEKVYKNLDLPKDKKVILYAPTFRDNQKGRKKGKFKFELKFDLEQMKKALGDEYIVLLRMHVVVSNSLDIPEEYSDMFIDVSKYPDIQELYLVSNILMTDYSSVMFDFANTRRPILYFTYDFENYRDNLRGFYIDFEAEAPGPLLSTTEEIIHSVQQIEQVTMAYAEKYKAFYEKYCSLEDGHAAERVVEKIFKKERN